MFKLESYIAPLLMGYIDKYVKLKHEDFQLSLWGGDVVLNKLDLRLDAIEQAIQLPITFKSGFIHELRIHVPWTKLGYEPVVITINTIECILKLRESGYDVHDSSSSRSTASSAQLSQPPRPKIQRQEAAEDLPPGYLQSLINRMMHNVNIVVNNLILKFVEDDIVLSVNVKSAECYSVNEDWTRAFVELAAPELVLRRIVDFHDLTVCLDKRNASGKIETYQDPLLYRCSLTCRMHMVYDSLHAKLPTITKFNVLCEKLDLSLTDTQVPMFFRLVELCLAIYYGTLELPSSGRAMSESEEMKPVEKTEIPRGGEEGAAGMVPEDESGWASWAWSYVPQILPTGEELAALEQQAAEQSAPPKKPQPAVLALGVYIVKTTVVFKLTETVSDPQYFGPQRVSFKPCARWEAEGIGLDVVLRGLLFFNVQMGISSTRVMCLGESISGVRDLDNTGRDPCCFQSSADTEQQLKPINYMSHSLFDPGAAENRHERPQFPFDPDKYSEEFTEDYAVQKFGIFWMDYLYTAEDTSDGGQTSGSRSSTNDEEDMEENAVTRFIIGAFQLTLNSSMRERLHKFVHCMNEHDYEPYSKPRKEEVEEASPPSESEVKSLEAFVPTRTYHMTMINPTIRLFAAELPEYDVSTRKTVSHRKAKRSKTKAVEEADLPSCPSPLPALLLQTQRLDLQVTAAMYPKKLVRAVTKMAAPSSNLLHLCHSHLHIKVFGLHVGVRAVYPGGLAGVVPCQTVVPAWSGAMYRKLLLLPRYWRNPLQPREEYMCELPSLTLSLTLAQLMLICHIAVTWTERCPNPARLLTVSLLDDVFKPGAGSVRQPVLEICGTGLEGKYCDTEAALSLTGSLASVQAIVLHSEGMKEGMTPILYGPVHTADIYNMELFTKEVERGKHPPATDGGDDLLTFTWQTPKNADMPQAPAAVVLRLRGLSGCLDPILYEWMTYSPVLKVAPSSQQPHRPPHCARDKQHLTLDAAVMHDTSPLKDKPPSQGSQSGSQATVPPDSQTQTCSLSASQTATQPHAHGTAPNGALDAAGASGQGTENSDTWGRKLAQMYPLVKIMQVEIEVYSWVAFLPVKHIALSDTTVNIPYNLSTAHRAGRLPDTLVICCPALKMLSSGHKPVTTVMDIPIKALEHSVAGEKLPWSIELKNCAMYTLHQSQSTSHVASLSLSQSQALLHVIKPASVSVTLAVTTKYVPPTSDNITALGLCLHADVETVQLQCAKPQLQLGYNLVTGVIQPLTGLWEAVRLMEQLYFQPANKAVPKDVVTPLPAAATGSATAKNTVHKTSSSGQLEPLDLLMGTITETSETSRGGSPFKEQEEEGGVVKLSLWLQWTLLRLVGKVYAQDTNGKDLCVMADLEDLTSSIDLQDVYSKVKCKVGSFNITHQIKSGSTWMTGDHDGVLLTCDDHFARNVPIAPNKLWAPPGHPVQRVFSTSDLKPRDKALGFMSLTFTRALQKNVKKRLKKTDTMEGLLGSDLSGGGDRSNGDCSTYLNEICLNLQPIDILLNCHVLASVLRIFSLETLELIYPSSKQACRSTDPSVHSTQPLITTAWLPFLYIDAASIRTFIPNLNDSLAALSVHPKATSTTSDLGMTPESSEQSLHGDSLASGDKKKETDVILVQVNMLSVAPQADNPLPRIVLEKDLYHKALQAGLTSQPGSEVEDRQYQLDITGLSLCTGYWSQVVSPRRKHSGGDMAKDPAAQNPALEWNTLLKTEEEVEDVFLVPMASSFDLRVVAAPAIVYTPLAADNKQALLVCGHSLEVNATSDMNFYVSTQQVKLVHQVLNTNLAPLLFTSDKSGKVGSSMQSFKRTGPKLAERSLQDSGVESEVSTVYNLGNQDKVTTQDEAQFADKGMQLCDWSKSLTPFDVLLTAGKISMMLYSVEEAEEVVTKETGDTSSGEWSLQAGMGTGLSLGVTPSFPLPHIITQGHAMNEAQQLFQFHQMTAQTEPACAPRQPARQLIPFVYLCFSQPHTLMSCVRDTQKAELSCFDVVLKGCKPGYCVSDEGKLIPDPSDFSVHWLETRPGEPDPKTGIPPSLYSLRVTDFLSGTADISLCLERPLRFNGSFCKLQQLHQFLDRLRGSLIGSLQAEHIQTNQSCTRGSSVDAHAKAEMVAPPQLPKALSFINNIQLQTVQLVVAMEATLNGTSAAAQLSLSSLDIVTDFNLNVKGAVEGITCAASMQDLMIKTSLKEYSRPLIGPLTSSLTLSSQWGGGANSGPAHTPQLLVAGESSMVQVFVGQEHLLCLQQFQRAIKQHFKDSMDMQSSEPPQRETPSKHRKEKSLAKEGEMLQSEDDLRRGEFEYVSDEVAGSKLLPCAGEIVFSQDSSTGRGTMTWGYCQPRALTQLEVTPVPFNLPQHLSAQGFDEHYQVPCLLQYWSPLLRKFENYASFHLSENHSQQVALPEVSQEWSGEVCVAKVWRVVVLHPADKDCGEPGDTDLEEGLEPLVSPVSLAASLRVDSRSVPALVPTVQLVFTSPRVQLKLANHYRHLGKKTPEELLPFQLDDSLPVDHECVVASVDNLSASFCQLQGQYSQYKIQASGSLQCEVLEYRYLTMLPLLEPVQLTVDAVTERFRQPHKVKASLCAQDVYLRVGQSAVHTLTTLVTGWNQVLSRDCEHMEQLVPHYYLLCNDTQQTLHFGQIDSDENIILQSRQAHAYSWRSHKVKQMLRLCMVGFEWNWCEPFDLDTEGTTVHTLEKGELHATLVVTVRPLMNTQKQVIISGQVMVCSRLTQSLEIKLLTLTPGTDGPVTLGPQETMASFVCEHASVRSLRVRLLAAKMPWSQEIPITGDKMKESRLVKIPMQDKVSFIHIWCHVFTELQQQGVAQNLEKEPVQKVVLFTPLFVVRTQLPSFLLMNIDTPQFRTSQQVELQGRGVNQQLHMMGGDTTHNITFQLSSSMKPSSPPVLLSSGLIEQMHHEPVPPHLPLDQLRYDWHADGVWPYNTQDPQDTHQHRSAGHKKEKLAPQIHQDIIVPQSPLAPHRPISLPQQQPQQQQQQQQPPPQQQSEDQPDTQRIQPNIDLQINLSQLWPACNTLLIDVVPYWLLVNQCGSSLVLRSQHGQQWHITSKGTLAPPVLKSAFQLGVNVLGRMHFSAELSLSDEDNESRYLPNVPGLLYLHSHQSVTIPVLKQGQHVQVCYLTLHSTIQHGMRVVTLREKLCVSNHTPLQLQIKCFALPLQPHKVNLDEEIVAEISLQCHQNTNLAQPLLFWNLPNKDQSNDKEPVTAEHVHYASFRLIGQAESHDQSVSTSEERLRWSQPIRLKLGTSGTRQSVSLERAAEEGRYETVPCVLSITEHKEITYVAIAEESYPAMLLHNNCDIGFHYGQSVRGNAIFDASIQEDAELCSFEPYIPPHSSCHYAFPSCNSSFPDMTTRVSTLRLHLAGRRPEPETQTVSDQQAKAGIPKAMWSTGINISECHDLFVSVPDTADIKVHIEVVGHTSHIYFDPVSRAEISAKEIRSRIKGKEKTVVVQTKPQVRKDSGGHDPKDVSSAGVIAGRVTPTRQHSTESAISKESSPSSVGVIAGRVTPTRQHSTESGISKESSPSSGHPRINKTLPAQSPLVELTLASKKLTFLLMAEDASQHDPVVCEVLRATADNVVAIYFPKQPLSALSSRHPHRFESMVISVGDLQVDNQLYAKGHFDFPVVLLQQDANKSELVLSEDFLKKSLEAKIHELSSQSMMTASCLLCTDQQTNITSLIDTEVSFKPLSLHVEDVFIYTVVDKLVKLVPVHHTPVKPHNQQNKPTVPIVVQHTLSHLNAPIRMQRFCIQPVGMLLSVHASMKLFIASDNTPLNFGKFERVDVFTNNAQLVRDLAMHYAAGALFRAGWVVGSLEILGNPTGLIRSISNGVVDLFRMPYESLAHGPGSFVVGVTHGMGSFLKNISAGALTSITNFASSVSRNMDRLSLDSAHFERQEESRRHKPAGVTEGLRNGLTGFGISMLGAIGGIADQPLQGITHAVSPAQPASSSQRATGIVSGMGKGLVGMVTKPVGGAAELLSQAGMGLLQGVGLSSLPRPRHTPMDEPIRVFSNGMVKYAEKLFRAVPKPEVLMVTEATQLYTSSQDPHQVCMVLTQEVLFIVSLEEDLHQQALAVCEVECQPQDTDSCLLYLMVKNGERSPATWNGTAPSATDRVAEFIDRAAKYAFGSGEEVSLEVSSAVETRANRLSPKGSYYYDFHMDAAQRDLFVALFAMTQCKGQGKGFSL